MKNKPGGERHLVIRFPAPFHSTGKWAAIMKK